MAKLREFDAPGSASKVGSKESLSAEASPASRVIKGRKQATSSTDILACYGLVGSAAKRALEAKFESAAEEVEEEEAESMDCLEISSEDAADASAQHDLAISRPIGKPYFDPSRGKFIQLLEDGSEQEGIMSPGPLGFCVVKLPDCEAFESQVPNLFLEAPAERKATRFQAPKKKARKISKAKSLAKAPELEAAEALEDDGSDGSANALENDSEAAEIPDMQITALAEASFEAGSTKEVGPGSAPNGMAMIFLLCQLMFALLSTAKANTVLQSREKRARSVWTFYFGKVLSGSRSQNNAKANTPGQGTARCMRPGMPCYTTAENVWECQLVQLGWIQQSRGCWISVARSTCAHWMQMQNMFFCSVPAKLCSFLLSRHVHVLLPCELTRMR